MKKVLRIAALTVGIIILAAVGLVLLTLLTLNVAKFFIYSDYYDIKTNICPNPGLGDGFVCQGIAVSEKDGVILVSGYMNDKTASRVYVQHLNSKKTICVELMKPDGKPFTGHAGGIAITGNNVYIANGSKIYTISLSKFTEAQNRDQVYVGEGTKVNNSASFVYTDETYLYVGEFHDGGKYVKEHPYETAEGTHHAIVTRYSIDDLKTPDRIYSIRDKVQGICFTPDGRVVMSTSYGLTDTVYYVYNESEARDSTLTLDGAPVYLLEKCVKEIKGPAMGEDLDWYDGKVITLTESASDKYIFGKFFFATKIVGLEF